MIDLIHWALTEASETEFVVFMVCWIAFILVLHLAAGWLGWWLGEKWFK